MYEQQLYLNATEYFNFEHPLIQEFVQKITSNTVPKKEKVIRLYYAIRDDWRYNPYKVLFEKEAYIASNIIQLREGHCIDKSILMTTCCRAIAVPARLCLAKVRNHIGVEQIIEKIGSDVLVPHGYVEVFLEGKWVKNTPVFNKELCERLNVATLEFDGKQDAIFQAFDKEGGQFMEYLEEYGSFEDVPLQLMFDLMKSHYPKFNES